MSNAQDDVQKAKDNAQENIESTKNKVQGSAEAIKDDAQQGAQAAKENVQAAKENVQQGAQAAKENVQQNVQAAKDKLPDVEKSIQTAKDKLPDIVPTPPDFKAQSSAQDVKSRLEWGEPGFTIVDVRDRNVFNDGHIMGAIPLPVDELVDRAQSSLDPSREIYVYGKTDAETTQAAAKLREAGFQKVAELQGGLDAWKAISGPTEGISESQAP